MLSKRELLEGSSRAQELAAVVEAAERALRSWEPAWSAFLDGGLCEEGLARLGVLSELRIDRDGGHRAAERCRLLFQRAEAARPVEEVEGDFGCLEIAGNFHCDPADAAHFRSAL